MVDRIRFTINKVDERLALEEAMQGKNNSLLDESPPSVRLTPSDYEKAKAVAPGWDIYYLEQEWREWLAKKGKPDNPSAAFISFCRKKHQRQAKP